MCALDEGQGEVLELDLPEARLVSLKGRDFWLAFDVQRRESKAAQSSTLSPGTRSMWSTSAVTKMAPAASAWAAMAASKSCRPFYF